MRTYFRPFLAMIILLLNFTACKVSQQSASTGTYHDYAARYGKIAISHMQKYRIPASITLAQGILESAGGNSRLAREANNHFGIKCTSDWRGATIYAEENKKKECYRKYKNVTDSYNDHALFLANRVYYKPLFKLNIHDYKAWAKGLQQCGYATDPQYANKLIRVIESYKLYQFDTKVKR